MGHGFLHTPNCDMNGMKEITMLANALERQADKLCLKAFAGVSRCVAATRVVRCLAQVRCPVSGYAGQLCPSVQGRYRAQKTVNYTDTTAQPVGSSPPRFLRNQTPDNRGL